MTHGWQAENIITDWSKLQTELKPSLRFFSAYTLRCGFKWVKKTEQTEQNKNFVSLLWADLKGTAYWMTQYCGTNQER